MAENGIKEDGTINDHIDPMAGIKTSTVETKAGNSHGHPRHTIEIPSHGKAGTMAGIRIEDGIPVTGTANGPDNLIGRTPDGKTTVEAALSSEKTRKMTGPRMESRNHLNHG